MKEPRLIIRVLYYDGTRLYQRCTSFNEVVQYVKKESVKEVLVSHDTILETQDCLPL